MSEEDHGSDHEDEHEGHAWGDYNASSPGASTLPPIGPWALGVFALALFALLGSILLYSMGLTGH